MICELTDNLEVYPMVFDLDSNTYLTVIMLLVNHCSSIYQKQQTSYTQDEIIDSSSSLQCIIGNNKLTVHLRYPVRNNVMGNTKIIFFCKISQFPIKYIKN